MMVGGRRDISEIISDLRRLDDEHPKDDHSTPFIIDRPPRNSAHYQSYNNNPEEPLWVVREVTPSNAGPPTLTPHGEVWEDEESGEELSGLKKWPIIPQNIVRRVGDEGIDALAWYRSFHYEPTDIWGIYMLDKGIYYLAEIFESQWGPADISPETRQDCINDAVNLLYYHEIFHFYTDLAATNLEIEESRSMYVDYFNNKYRNGWLVSDGAPTDIYAMLEEALANEFARSKIIRGRDQSYKDALTDFMNSQPDGYKHWKAVKHNKKWDRGLSQLGERILNLEDEAGDPKPLPQDMHVTALRDAIHPSYERQVPVYIVDTIPDDIYRFATMSIFNNINILQSVLDTISHKKTPPNVRKNFHSTIKKLRGWGSITRNEKWNKTAKEDTYFWKLSADAWRMCFVRDNENPSHWDIVWVGPHKKYDNYRVANNLN